MCPVIVGECGPGRRHRAMAARSSHRCGAGIAAPAALNQAPCPRAMPRQVRAVRRGRPSRVSRRPGVHARTHRATRAPLPGQECSTARRRWCRPAPKPRWLRAAPVPVPRRAPAPPPACRRRYRRPRWYPPRPRRTRAGAGSPRPRAPRSPRRPGSRLRTAPAGVAARPPGRGCRRPASPARPR